MNSNELKQAVREWGERKGRDVAFKLLVNADVSGSMADKLLAGRYGPRLGLDKANDIMNVLKQDGFPLAGEKAS